MQILELVFEEFLGFIDSKYLHLISFVTIIKLSVSLLGFLVYS